MHSFELSEIQTGFLNFARHCTSASGGECGSESGCHWFSTPIDFPAFSGVSHTTFASDTDIDRTISLLNSKNRSWGWFLTPECQPIDLAEKLQSRGFTSVVQLTGMIARFDEIVPTPEPPKGVEIKEVRSEQDIRAYAAIYPLLFDSPDTSFFPDVADMELSAESSTRRYLALEDGESVAAGSVTSSNGIATLDTLCTLPKARNRGIGAALALTALRNEEAAGANRATIWAGPGAEKLYARLGFRALYPIDIYMAIPDSRDH
jgi:GNAT superfamily N-acetyltransferase